jgi:hypothetical protein
MMELAIFNAQGQVIHACQAKNGTKISLADQEAGYYFIRGIQKDGSVFSAKLLKAE